MELTDVLRIVIEKQSQLLLHSDHICSDPVPHGLNACSFDVSVIYTAFDAITDTPDELRARLATGAGIKPLKSKVT